MGIGLGVGLPMDGIPRGTMNFAPATTRSIAAHATANSTDQSIEPSLTVTEMKKFMAQNLQKTHGLIHSQQVLLALINAGITIVIYGEGYADDLAREMMGETGIMVKHFTPDVQEQTV